MLYLGIYVRRFFNAGWSCRKVVSGGSLGGPGGSENCSWRGPGAPRRWPRGSKNGFGRGKSAQERPRRILEPSWSPKQKYDTIFWGGFWEAWAVFGEALGGLGGAFFSDLVAHRFFIDFLPIFRRFGDGFWYQKSMKKRIENEADFKVFF